jgi:acetyltransferase-like isoleucine patch superfamily enzyme
LTYLDAGRVEIGARAAIGHFNVVKGVKHFSVGSDVHIKHLNVFSGADFAEWPSSISLEDDVHVMNLHYFDVAGTVFIRRGTTIGGRGTQIWSHERAGPSHARVLTNGDVEVGPDAYIGARSILLPNSRLNASCALGAGSVLTAAQRECPPRAVLAGNPARVVSSESETDEGLAPS